jgi:hypothetical protein
MTSLRAIGALALVGALACSNGGGGSDAGTSGSTGQAGAAGSTGGAAGGVAGSSPTAGAGGETGGTAGAATTGGASGQAGGGAGASGGASGGQAGAAQAGTGGGGASGQGGGAGSPDQAGATGTFVMCDDHADFNGRGRCAATGKVGAVFALQSRSAASASTTLTAVFGTTSPPWTSGCTSASAGGSCVALTCPKSARPAVTGPEAGAITAKSNGGMIVTKPGAGGAYDVGALGRALWSLPKTALAFSAAGGAIGAFGETFCGPPPITISKPAGVPGAGLTIDRATDLALQWTSAPVGDLEFVLRDDTDLASPSVEVRCTFVAAAGQGTVPKAALAKLGAGARTVASFLWVRKIGLGSGTCVELTGIQTNNAADGATPFFGAATFQ